MPRCAEEHHDRNEETTVDGRKPAPVEVGSLSHYLQGFVNRRSCRISSIYIFQTVYCTRMWVYLWLEFVENSGRICVSPLNVPSGILISCDQESRNDIRAGLESLVYFFFASWWMHHWNDQSLFGPPRAINPFAGFSPQKKELWILFQTHRTCVISCHFPGLVIFDIRKPVPKYHPETRWLQVPGVKSHRVPHPFSSFYQLPPRIWWIFDTWVRRDVLDFFHFQGGAVELLESEWSLFDEIFRIGTFKCCLVEQLYGKIANKMNQKLHLYILQMLSTSTQLTYRLIFDPSHCDFC